MTSEDTYYLTASGTALGPDRPDEFVARFRAIMYLLASEPQAIVYTVQAESVDEARARLVIIMETPSNARDDRGDRLR